MQARPSFKQSQNWLKFSLFAVLTLALTACATKSVEKDFSLTPGSDKGLIIGSVTAETTPSAYISETRFFYQKKTATPVPGFENPFIYVETGPGYSVRGGDFEYFNGTVFAIELPAGEYIFNDWRLINGEALEVIPINPRPVSFTVHGGRATYIGNLHMTFKEGKNLFDQPIITDGSPSIDDQSIRDIPLLLERYPNISRKSIDVRIIDGRPWGGKAPKPQINAQLAN